MRPPSAALHPANPAEPTSDADDHAYQDTTACTDHALLVSKKCRFVIGGDTIRYDTIRDAILTCARKPTWIGLIYRMVPTFVQPILNSKLKNV